MLGHAVCFYVFQIVYPPTVTLLPPPARVSLITPTSEEGRTLLRWIEAEDPALASNTQRSPETASFSLPKIEHVPSYLGYQPALKLPSSSPVGLRVPNAQPPRAAPAVRSKTPTTAGRAPTAVSFSNELQSLGVASLPAMKFAASRNEPPENVRFRVAVRGDGEIRYCFPLNSSGDPSLDEQAREYLALCRFLERSDDLSPDAVVWGIATVEWGNDVEPVPERSRMTKP